MKISITKEHSVRIEIEGQTFLLTQGEAYSLESHLNDVRISINKDKEDLEKLKESKKNNDKQKSN